MVPAAIPEAKWLISRLTLAETRRLADQAVRLTSAAEVEALVREALGDLLE